MLDMACNGFILECMSVEGVLEGVIVEGDVWSACPSNVPNRNTEFEAGRCG